jgi:hypothetical protein
MFKVKLPIFKEVFMKKFGVYNYINRPIKPSDTDLEPMSLLLNLMANKNTNIMGTPLNNNCQNEQNKTQSENQNDGSLTQQPQKEYNPAIKDYISLYPQPKV